MFCHQVVVTSIRGLSDTDKGRILADHMSHRETTAIQHYMISNGLDNTNLATSLVDIALGVDNM